MSSETQNDECSPANADAALPRTEDETTKVPLIKFKPTFHASITVVLPMNFKRLQKHDSNIKKYILARDWKSLNVEHINTTRTVKQVTSTVSDLNKIKEQIIEKDYDMYLGQTEPIKIQILNIVHDFALLQHVLLSEIQGSVNGERRPETTNSQHPLLNNDKEVIDDQQAENPDTNNNIQIFFKGPITRLVLLGDHDVDDVKEEMSVCHSWDCLRENLLELRKLLELPSSENRNINGQTDNENTGTTFTEDFKTLLNMGGRYTPLAVSTLGAVVGGLVGGPVGSIAGLKIGTFAAALGGGFAGYQGGKYFKGKVEASNRGEQDESKPHTSIETPD